MATRSVARVASLTRRRQLLVVVSIPRIRSRSLCSSSISPFDLLGVDPDGEIVLFELKRGTLTREAVAEILDYASDLLERDSNDFANLIESSSGRSGIDRIDDFAEWFSAESQTFRNRISIVSVWFS